MAQKTIRSGQIDGGGGSAPDASTSVKGIVRLAGDLAGTSASPTVPALANKLDTATATSTYAPKATPVFTGRVSSNGPLRGSDFELSSTGAGYAVNAYYDSGWKYIGAGRASLMSADAANGGFRFYTAPAGSANGVVSFTEQTWISPNGLSPSKLLSGDIQPADNGLLAWAYDPLMLNGGATLSTNGLAYGTVLSIPKAMNITSIVFFNETAETAGTSNQNFLALYQNDTLIAQTVDMTSAVSTTGIKTVNLTSPQTIQPGTVTVICWGNVGSGSLFAPSGYSVLGSRLLYNYGSGTPRFFTANTGLTTTAPTTLGTKTAVNRPYWFGLV